MRRALNDDKQPEQQDPDFVAGVDQQAMDAMSDSGETAMMLAGEGNHGDIDVARDIKRPRLQIVYQMGWGATSPFVPGSLVLNQEDLVAAKGEVIKLTVVDFFQYWKEWLPSEIAKTGQHPETFKTEADAIAAGFATQYNPAGRIGKQAAAAMDLKVLIEKPEKVVSNYFGLEIEGKFYAPARWTVDKMAYKPVGPAIIYNYKTTLKTRGIASGIWSVHTEIVPPKNGTTYTNPVCKLSGANTQAFVDIVAGSTGKGPAPKEIQA